MADWRYPFNPGLNQSAQLPASFGPPNMSSQIQGAISGLADPILAAILKRQQEETGSKLGEAMIKLGQSYAPAAGTTTGTSDTSTVLNRAPSTAQGSPAGDDSTGVMGGGRSAVTNPEVRDKFISEARATGLINPYGLGALAATGQRESGWSLGNVNRTWQDGVNRSGGALSWNGPRLRAMQEFTAGAEDPVAAQAAFFMKENPRLIAALNATKSADEANELMANAWRYKGYNTDSAEFRARQNLTRAYASKFERAPEPQPAPTASFAPTVAPAPTPQAAAAVTAPGGNQPTTAQPMLPPRPAGAYGGIPFEQPQGPQRAMPQQSAAQAAPQEQTQQGKAEAQQQEIIQNVGEGTQQLQQRLDTQRQEGQRTRVASISPELPGLNLGGVMPGGPPQPPPRPPDLQPQTVPPQPPAAGPATTGPAAPQPEPVVAPPVRTAQAATGLPPAINVPQQQRVQRPITDEEGIALLKLAKTPEQQAAVVNFVLKSREPQALPAKRFEIKDGYRIDQIDGSVTPLSEVPVPGMFKGNSIEGQALNYLVANGTLTPNQAAAVAAGKKVTGADGADYWFRPQDLAGGPAGPGIMRQPGTGGGAPPAAPGAPTSPGAPAAPAPDGPRQLTPPKADKPDNLSPEASARITMGNTFLEKVPTIRKMIEDGALDTAKSRVQLKYGYGDPGTIKRVVQSGKDALLRSLTGAGMNLAEATEYVERYEPSIRDDRRNLLEKLDGLAQELKAAREGVLSGRRITDPALRGREPPGSGGKGFTTPGGVRFEEVR